MRVLNRSKLPKNLEYTYNGNTYKLNTNLSVMRNIDKVKLNKLIKDKEKIGNRYIQFNILSANLKNATDLRGNDYSPSVHIFEFKALQTKAEDIDLTQVNNDSSGNPRYVVHFLAFSEILSHSDIDKKYNEALNYAKEIFGRKFHNKQFGGGIVFASYPQKIKKDILAIIRKYKN